MNTELIIALAMALVSAIGIPAGLLIAYGRMHRRLMNNDKRACEQALGGPCVD